MSENEEKAQIFSQKELLQMNVFVIHSGADVDTVTKKISELKKLSHGFNPLILKNGNIFWKLDAAEKIKKSQMAVFFVGKNSHSSPYIAWEIQTAIKYGKPIYTIMLDSSFENHPALTVRDSFSGSEKAYDKKVTFEELSELVKNYETGDYKVFNCDAEKIDSNILLEQYKIFLQTSEDLISRRQNVNSFYISINSALVTAFSFVLALDMPPVYKLLISLVLVLVGVILSVSWIRILVSYGDLNSSKMKIISCIEKQLPASLYDAEWAALSDKLNKRKYVSFTNSEKNIPVLFIFVYVCILVGVSAFVLH